MKYQHIINLLPYTSPFLFVDALTNVDNDGVKGSYTFKKNADFYKGKVIVTAEKKYFRFQKLKCLVKMHNSEGKLVCKGNIAGMLKIENNA